MGKRLIITEKPSVAKDIAAALGGFTKSDDAYESHDFLITWAVGHLVGLAEPNEYADDELLPHEGEVPLIPKRFKLAVRRGKKGDSQTQARNQARLDAIGKLGRRKDVVGLVNACDAGREGELIFRTLVDFLDLRQPSERLWLQSMTGDAIRAAFAHLRPSSEYEGLANAAHLRSQGDWLVGMNASRAVRSRIERRFSKVSWPIGRVQTPTLYMVVERERRIQAHQPRPYWTVSGVFTHLGASWEASLVNPSAKEERSDDGERAAANPWFDRAALDRAEAVLRSRKLGRASERRLKSVEKAPALFDLTTLQKTANNKAGFSAKRTLDAAQRLYDTHKVLTYPRTDSRHLPDDYGPQVQEVLAYLAQGTDHGAVARQILKDGPQNLDKVLDGAKVSDHFAIIPTGTPPEKPLAGDDLRIYQLVCQQFLAALMPPAVYSRVERTVEVGEGNEVLVFKASAKTLEEPGYMAAFGKEVVEGRQLPPLIPGADRADGVEVTLEDWEEEEAETRPPARFTEAGLLARMESAGRDIDDAQLAEAMKERGLGTPATRADTIETLIGKEYLRRVDRSLAPTAKGMRLIDVLERAHVDSLCSPALTGEWEHRLDGVQRGVVPAEAMRQELLDGAREYVRLITGFDREGIYAADADLGPCPSGDGGVVRENLFGYACTHNTGKDASSPCKFMLWKERAGRYIDRRTAEALVRNGQAGPLEAFDVVSKSSVIVNFKLVRVEDGKWEVDVHYGDQISETGPEEVLGDLCADPSFPDSRIIETTRRYVSRKLFDGEVRKGAPVLPKVVCLRPVSREEALAYFGEDGRTPMIEGWISKRGKPFTGALIRQESGRHRFEFPPRGKGRGAAAEEGPEGPGAEAAPAKAPKATKEPKAAKSTAKAPKATKEPKAAKASTKAPKAAAPAKGTTPAAPRTVRRAAKSEGT